MTGQAVQVSIHQEVQEKCEGSTIKETHIQDYDPNQLFED